MRRGANDARTGFKSDITGFLIEKTGSYTPPFMLAATLIALGPIALWSIVGSLGDARHPLPG